MFDSLIKIFEDKNLNQNMALRKQLKNVKIQNAEHLEVVEEEVENEKVVIARIIEFIHSRNEVITLNRIWEEEEKSCLIRREEEIWEQLKIKLSPFKEDPSSDEECEELNS